MPDAALVARSADALFRAFESYMRSFRVITRRARQRFEDRDHAGLRADAAERIDLYRRVVDAAVYDLEQSLDERVHDKALWAGMRADYSDRLRQRGDWELAETFYNSITRRLFTTVGVDANIEFVASHVKKPAPQPVWRVYEGAGAMPDVFEAVLQDYAFTVPFRNARADAEACAARLRAHLRTVEAVRHLDRLELADSIFYRGEGAFLIGRLYCGTYTTPFALCLLHGDDGVYVDALLLSEDDVSILFSFTRSYFLVHAERPYDLVRFLKSLMPRKRVAELYIAIGHAKHGKTELYRDILRHLAQADEDEVFVRAPGQRGMVMIVFTMPSYDLVFKLIKDRFDPPKQGTRQTVMARYDLVYRHERAGRLVDAQPFEHLTFALRHFSPELLEELLRVAPKTVRVEGDQVHIAHVYVERRVTPLDVYIRKHGENAHEAVIDYGHAIKDLARSNIFAGDLLLKNFGVTRHGRIVFYDYDEVQRMTEVNFRDKPQSSRHEDELKVNWFYAGPDDVFPEEFLHALGLRESLRSLFVEHHADLFTAAFWRDLQARIRDGEVVRIPPYADDRRLSA